MHREIARALRGRKARAFAQLHHRPVAQFEHRARVFRRADFDAVRQFLPRRQRTNSRGRNLVQRPVDGLHQRASRSFARRVEIEIERHTRSRDDRCRDGPPVHRHRLPRRRHRHSDHSALVHATARHTLVQVVLDQSSPRQRQLSGAIFRQQRAEVVAVPDMRMVCLFLQLGPHARRRGFNQRGVDSFIADFFHGALQCGVDRVEFSRVHATPPMYARYSFSSRSRVRDNVTATVPGVVFNSRAISDSLCLRRTASQTSARSSD